MDELALLGEFGMDTPLRTAAELAPARARLMEVLAESSTATPVIGRPTNDVPVPRGSRLPTLNGPPRRPRWALVVGAVATVGVAAAVVGVVGLSGGEAENSPGQQVAASTKTPPPVVRVEAEQVLRLAAEATLRQPDAPPRPDQFIYTKTQNMDGTFREAWLSADGTRDGLIKQEGEQIPLAGCRDGQAAGVKGDEIVPGQFEPCEPMPAYQPDLPTDGAAMAAYLKVDSAGRVNTLAKNIYSLVNETYVRPASLAAVFDAVAQIDGLTVVDNVTDGAGRPGVGVRWTNTGAALTLVFDAESHEFLGMEDGSAAVVKTIVDEVGQQG